MDRFEIEQRVQRELRLLEQEFESNVPAEHVHAVAQDCLETLLSRATVYDFIPTLVYRQTRNEPSHSDQRRASRRGACPKLRR